MKDDDLITCRDVKLLLLEKGQRSRRYRLGDVWELNFDEIREALAGYRPKIVRCEECKWNQSTEHNPICEKYYGAGSVGWFCADGKRRLDGNDEE